MRAIRGAATALLATAALCLAAPTAGAADDGAWGDGALGDGTGTGEGAGEGIGEGTGHNITSFGFSVSPETVAPGGMVTLKSDGCEVPTVTVTSGVFDKVTLNEGHPGTATVDVAAKVGAEYQVTFECKGQKGTATLTIAGGSTAAHKGVKAGFGGGAGELGVMEVVTGTALIAGALGGGVLLMRRRGADDRL